jgi:hypothetical protein
MTIYSPDKNGIPNINGIHRPTLTLALTTLEVQFPSADDTFNFTYSLQLNGDSDSDNKLFSSAGR